MTPSLIQKQDKGSAKGFLANLRNSIDDVRRILTLHNAPAIAHVLGRILTGHGLDVSFPTSWKSDSQGLINHFYR